MISFPVRIPINIPDTNLLMVAAGICPIGRGNRIITSLIFDTGSDRTTLAESDVLRMGLKLNELKPARESARGVAGGKIELFRLNGVMFSFPCTASSQAYEVMVEDVLVRANPPREEKKYKRQMKKRTLTPSPPSILGIDFLFNHAALLMVDAQKKEGFIEIRKD